MAIPFIPGVNGASMQIPFNYQGPAGTLTVNWWIVANGTAPRAFGGVVGNEFAYKSTTVAVPALSTWTDQVAAASIEKGWLSSMPGGLADCYIGIYWGTGASATLLGSWVWGSVYDVQYPLAPSIGMPGVVYPFGIT